jgi:hypothetical protein
MVLEIVAIALSALVLAAVDAMVVQGLIGLLKPVRPRSWVPRQGR